MKNIFYPALVLVAVLFIESCSTGCVDCSSVASSGINKTKYCKSDYEAAYPNSTTSWDTYRNALIASGCKGV